MLFVATFFKKKFFSPFCKKIEKPLGRWSQCGEKKNIENILEFKIHQKKRRHYLLETGIDPYHLSIHPKVTPPFIVQN